MNQKLWKAVDKKLAKTEVMSAIQMLEQSLAKEKVGHFRRLIGLQFTNSPASILTGINQFIRLCEKTIDVKAVYLEMNGFDINYDRWYFDSFGYETCGKKSDDLEWLCDWQVESQKQIRLRGLETGQKDFEAYHKQKLWKADEYEAVCEIATLLIMAKFVLLIQSALHSGNLIKPVPVLATAHDFDIIGRFDP